MSRQEGLEEQQVFDSELDVSPRIGVEQKEAIREFEELSEHPPRAVTQRQHLRQRAQQGVPIPEESYGREDEASQDRRLSQEPLYVMPRQSALVKQPAVLPVPLERPSPSLLPGSSEAELASALRRNRALRRWLAFIYRFSDCGVRVLCNSLPISSGETPTQMVTDEGGAMLILPTCVACRKVPATEICLGHMCNASRCYACVQS